MSNVASPPDTAPRRLKFSQPDPAPRAPRREDPKAARARRASKPERFAPVANGDRERSRLPHGAHFDVTYDADDVRWRGTLTIGEVVVTGDAPGVMTLLSVLDVKWRAKVAKLANAAEATAR